jgi:hypothetical protein
MTDEDAIPEEEMEDTEVEGEEDIDAEDETLEAEDTPYVGKTAKVVESEVLEDFSIASRQKARDQLEEQIAAFLARGGKIAEVPPNVTADPPKKPTPDYGGRPI